MPILIRRLGELKQEGNDKAYDWLDSVLQTEIYKVGITYETITPESSEEGDFADSGWEKEYEDSSIKDILREKNNYGISEPSSSQPHAGMWWSSVDPSGTRDYYEKDEEKYYGLHLKHLDNSELSEEEIIFFNGLITGKTKI